MKQLTRIVLFSLGILAGNGALSIASAAPAPATTPAVCVVDKDCVSICGTKAPTGYVTTGFLCQTASAVGSGFNNKCVRLMWKTNAAYANVPNPLYSTTCPQ